MANTKGRFPRKDPVRRERALILALALSFLALYATQQLAAQLAAPLTLVKAGYLLPWRFLLLQPMRSLAPSNKLYRASGFAKGIWKRKATATISSLK